MQNLFISIAIVLAGLSCKAPQTSTSSLEENQTAVSLIDSVKWRLIKIHMPSGSQPETITVTGAKAFIRFDQVKGSAGGNGSCNSFGSTMKLKGNEISFTNIFSTKMYCDEVQSIENAFLGQLQKITGNNLFLRDGDRVLLEFEKE